MRKIAIITGTRAEYGLLYWIIKKIHHDPDLKLQLIVTGMHLSPKFGSTVKEITKDGFPISARVTMLGDSDSELAIAQAMAKGVAGFATAYARLKPDVLVVLGDRFEILAAVSAAVPFRIPVAHIHGGESTEGLIDEVIRHAVTKMSHLHFASTGHYVRRIKQMGEDPKRIFCFGAPGLDNVYKLKLLNRSELLRQLGIRFDSSKLGVVTYHPVTLEKATAGRDMNELLKALTKFSEVTWIFTLPNAETGSAVIIQKIRSFVKQNKNAYAFASLGQLKYLSLLKQADVMVGNSSSGLIEAPSFALPVVNIGDRQRGRVRAPNVIDVNSCRAVTIQPALTEALSSAFRQSLKGMKNPYGQGEASEKIVQVLKSFPLGESLLKKKFYEVEATGVGVLRQSIGELSRNRLKG